MRLPAIAVTRNTQTNDFRVRLPSRRWPGRKISKLPESENVKKLARTIRFSRSNSRVFTLFRFFPAFRRSRPRTLRFPVETTVFSFRGCAAARENMRGDVITKNNIHPKVQSRVTRPTTGCAIRKLLPKFLARHIHRKTHAFPCWRLRSRRDGLNEFGDLIPDEWRTLKYASLIPNFLTWTSHVTVVSASEGLYI